MLIVNTVLYRSLIQCCMFCDCVSTPQKTTPTPSLSSPPLHNLLPSQQPLEKSSNVLIILQLNIWKESVRECVCFHILQLVATSQFLVYFGVLILLLTHLSWYGCNMYFWLHWSCENRCIRMLSEMHYGVKMLHCSLNSNSISNPNTTCPA